MGKLDIPPTIVKDDEKEDETISIHEHTRKKATIEDFGEEDVVDLGEYHGLPKIEKGKKRGLRAMADEEVEDARQEFKERMEALKKRQESAAMKSPGEKTDDTKEEEEPKIDELGALSPEEVAAERAAAEAALAESEKLEDGEQKAGAAAERLDQADNEELEKRARALHKAMGEILENAATEKYAPGEKKKLKRYIKRGKNARAESWPLDDAITTENYQERLGKYGIADYIDPALIEKNQSAYAVVAKQYAEYMRRLKGEPESKKAELPSEEAQKKLEEKFFGKDKMLEEETMEMEAEALKKGEEMPKELKEELGEDIEEAIESEELDKEIAAAIRKDIESEEKIEKSLLKPLQAKPEIKEDKERFIETAVIKTKDVKKRIAAIEKAKKALKPKKSPDVLGLEAVIREARHEREKGIWKKPKTPEKKGVLDRIKSIFRGKK